MKYKRSCSRPETFWPRAVIRKWLNISNRGSESDYGADSDHDVSDAEMEKEELLEEDRDLPVKEALPQTRRRKSETFRIQYINKKEVSISVSTWNVGGKHPPDTLDIEDWLNVSERSDIYVIGFQEIIPLNAGNIFGNEDSRPVSKWENIIRETLNKTKPAKAKFKCYSDPSSPSRFKPSDEAPVLLDEILLESDSEEEEEIYPLDEETDDIYEVRDRLNCLLTKDSTGNDVASSVPFLNSIAAKALSTTERIGLTWPEPPLDLLGLCALETASKTFKTSKSFKTYNSFKLPVIEADTRLQIEADLLAELDLESLIYRKRRSPYVKMVSKQMVGIFLTIWVRRSLRRHIHNVNVSTVGVGAMGYIGNKGSISVSMSIYQTFFCFICSHLSSGEKDGDTIKRNAGVYEIHRRTHFNSFSSVRLPKCIHDHERIIWMGDLNFRINLSYEKTRELISEKNWPKLVESDQLIRELRKGRSFDGWSEGILNFAPTYKYECNSDKYCGEDPKVGIGRRTPAWCDRILSSGKGMKLLSYRRTEHGLSDHRPVTASYLVEVEVFSPRKLQRALTFTDAEIQGEVTLPKVGFAVGMSSAKFREVPSARVAIKSLGNPKRVDAVGSGSSKVTERLKRR